jgi:ATP-binding protein involved in chromosome partitioning
MLPLPGVTYVLAVASGKGGVGKTTVSVNLALALQQSGARVGLFDADLYGPNVPLMLGIRRKSAAQGLVPVARADPQPYIKPLERFGLKVMSLGFLLGDTTTIQPDALFAGQIIRQTLQDVLWAPLDFLLIDLPPGTGEPQHTLARTVPLNGVLIVTTPQDLSLMDASRSLGMFWEAGIPILGVIENMSYLHCPHCGEEIEVFHRSGRKWLVEDEELERLGRIPMDIAISRGIDAGHPLMQAVPDAPQAKAFLDIAGKIIEKFAGKE